MLDFVVLLCCTLVVSFPVYGSNDTGIVSRDGFDESMFKGLDWTEAKKDCDPGKLAIIQQATHVAVMYMLSPDALRDHDNAQWDWFFKNEQFARTPNGWNDRGDVRNLHILYSSES